MKTNKNKPATRCPRRFGESRANRARWRGFRPRRTRPCKLYTCRSTDSWQWNCAPWWGRWLLWPSGQCALRPRARPGPTRSWCKKVINSSIASLSPFLPSLLPLSFFPSFISFLPPLLPPSLTSFLSSSLTSFLYFLPFSFPSLLPSFVLYLSKHANKNFKPQSPDR